MRPFVVFLRAVNVAGRSVPMAALRTHLTAAGFGDVASYIQSGNLLLSTELPREDDVATAVQDTVGKHFGVPTAAVVRTPAELADIARVGAALPDPFASPSRRYVALAQEAFPPAALAELDAWSVPGERAKVVGRECFLWFEVPFHKARLGNARIERTGVVSTTRDWKVVTALAERWGG